MRFHIPSFIVIRFFDRDDDLISIESLTTAQYISPGETERFTDNALIDVDDITRYEVDVVVQR